MQEDWWEQVHHRFLAEKGRKPRELAGLESWRLWREVRAPALQISGSGDTRCGVVSGVGWVTIRFQQPARSPRRSMQGQFEHRLQADHSALEIVEAARSWRAGSKGSMTQGLLLNAMLVAQRETIVR